MKRLIYCLSIALSVIFCTSTTAQDTLLLDLPTLVNLAQSDAPDVLIAQTRAKNSYWYYQSKLADFRPAVRITGQLPDLNRSIDIITQPNGEDLFLQRAQMRNQLGIALEQPIPATGGRVLFGSSIQRLDIFKEASDDIVSYYTTPLSIGLIQPLFGFNTLKWNRRIEPVRYQYATRQFAEEMEEVAYKAVEHYFQVLIAQFELEAALQDKANADTLVRISEDRFAVGRISESEILNARLQAMNAEVAVQEATLALQSSMERLRNFLGIKSRVAFQMSLPDELPEASLDEQVLVERALENRSATLSWQLRQLESEAAIAQAKANNGLQMDIFAWFSLSKTSDEFSQAYANPLDNEVLRVGFSIPLFDWGKARARLETAQTNRDLTLYTIEQEAVNLEQEVRLKALQFSFLRSKALQAQQAYQVAVQREQMTRNRYLIGRDDLLALNVALQEKVLARTAYLGALRDFWLGYYDLRRLTLYDFERGVSLVREPPR